ncbi:MAG: DsbA family protein [Candidatus Binatia bacterium]
MSTEQKTNSGMPVIIIVAVLIVVIVGAYFLYNRSSEQKAANNINSVKPTPVAVSNPVIAPEGATPPHMLGSPTAAVTVEEFADFQCPSCGDKYPIIKQVQSLYGSRIKFIFRNFPLQMHDKAYDAAVAAEAAGLQDKFWDMQNQLYTNQKSWSVDPNYREVWAGYAQKIGLDVEKYKNDMAGLQTKSRVDADMARGRALQVNSTPTVYINGKSVQYTDMTVETMRQLIDSELQAASTASRPAVNTAGTAPVNTNQKANANQK